jgi:16S rRNA (uracil1498-N3)-methyltransferase
MNLILLREEDFVENAGTARIEGRRLRHVLEVHRASPGDELCVGMLGGERGKGRITELTGEYLEMDVRLGLAPPSALPVTLILALPRPKVLKRTLITASSMGVKRIILINSYRVEKSFWQSPVLKKENIERQLLLGLEQARDTIMADVIARPLFKPFVEDELPDIIKGTLPLLAHPHASALCPRGIEGRATLAVGPEGGFIPYEIEKFSACGFLPVRMGERVLSVECAVPALLSRLF